MGTILGIVVQAAIDFGVMYHYDFSELEVVGGIGSHLCILLLDDIIVVPEGHFCFLDFEPFLWWA
jgi:hypothetical protein